MPFSTFEDFLRETLPPPPARLLEVGAGRGELATTLSAAGYDVLAIDPAAPAGEIFRPLLLEELDERPGAFAAVVAARSLHHIRDLDAALERIAALLAPTGVLAVEEFSWDLADDATLDWRRRQIAAAPATAEEIRAEWEADHLGLHGDRVLCTALEARFQRLAFERVPAIYRELGGASSAVLEASLIEAGEIRALGFRWAGTPTA